MPFWIPAIAAGAAVALVGKVIQRHLNGQLAQSAIDDPDGIRTVARFRCDATAPLLHTVAGELIDAVDVTPDAIRARGVDIVRLAASGDGYTLTLTRAFTGPQLDARATEILAVIHRALTRAGARDLAWHARQDREHARPHAHPFY